MVRIALGGGQPEQFAKPRGIGPLTGKGCERDRNFTRETVTTLPGWSPKRRPNAENKGKFYSTHTTGERELFKGMFFFLKLGRKKVSKKSEKEGTGKLRKVSTGAIEQARPHAGKLVVEASLKQTYWGQNTKDVGYVCRTTLE